jgi:dCMP deaminase
MNRQQKWDLRYLGLAEYVAQWSKDPSTKVGAVVVSQHNSVISVGYNGFPVGVHDTDERLNNREVKYKMVVHGEVNAISFANRDLHGCTVYTWPFMPCSVCAGVIIQNGITRVVAPWSDNPRWVDSFKLTSQMFYEAKVELVEVHEDGRRHIPRFLYDYEHHDQPACPSCFELNKSQAL